MIIPEHRRAIMEHEDRQALIERPALDEDALEELNRSLAEAMERGRLVTLLVFKPTGLEEVDMLPQRVADGKLRGLDRDGDRVSVAIVDVVGVSGG
ncbi:YolD-like family protein [Tumebacillus sp. DT12]|uniref:YolD-like family protein n=1 Tax=Tumebacillus lacus TaxID=2995335 RepID=A0ABT3X3M8_9BACL|nr:YolD-like family protein [Tumebacillus lacus]MCX7570427.1 YolD-like family protein [Tumebacillus lacus]